MTKKYYSLWILPLGIGLFILEITLPVSITSELGPIIPWTAAIFTLIGTIGLFRFISSRFSDRRFGQVGVTFTFMAVISFCIAYFTTIDEVKIITGLLGIPFLLIGLIALVRSSKQKTRILLNRLGTVFFGAPILSLSIAIIYYIGFSLVEKSAFVTQYEPNTNGKLWEWLRYGFVTSLSGSVAIFILSIFLLAVTGSFGSRTWTVVPRLGGGYTVSAPSPNTSVFNGGCLPWILMLLPGVILYGLVYGFSEWLFLQRSVGFREIFAYSAFTVSMGVFIFWGTGKT